MWVWRCLLGGNASLILPVFSGCCWKGVPAVLKVFHSSHFCLCSPYASFKSEFDFESYECNQDQTAALVVFPGCVSVCNLLPSAVWPNPAILPGSFAFLLASSFLPTGFTARRCLSVGQKELVLWRFSGLPITCRVCMKFRLLRVGGKRWTGHCAGYSAWPSSHNIQLWSSSQKWKSP